MREVVIEIGGPGLGDSLSYSTLPQELISQGFATRVLIREPAAGWRNPEIRALWEADQFVYGFTTTAPATKFHRFYPHRAPRSFASWTLGMQNNYGLRPETPYPIIYRVPVLREDCRYKVLLDPRSSSQQFPPGIIDRYVNNLAYQFEFDASDVLVIESPYSSQYGADAMPDNARLNIGGLNDLCDAIASCEIMLTVESGTHMLASAIKGSSESPHVVSLFTAKQFNDRIFVHSNIDYRVTAFDGIDWHDYSFP